MFFANISSDAGNYDLEADSLEALANKLPEDWRGTARARNAAGVLVGYIGRDKNGVANWKVV